MISVTNPEATATLNRRKNLSKIYAGKKWREDSKRFLGIREIKIRGIIRGEGLQVGEAGMLLYEFEYWYERKKPCQECLKAGIINKEHTLAHHPYAASYKDGSYADLYLSSCMVLCFRCHYGVHHGLLLCKRCGKKYHRVGADMCRDCFNEMNPEIVEARKKRIEDTKALKKKLRDEEKERVKKWKKEHPLRK